METTSGVTYRRPSLNGPVEPINRQFYKTQRWNVIQDTNLGNSIIIYYIQNLKFKSYIYRKK
jgi:hypothetical protein